MKNIILTQAITEQDFNHGKLLFKEYASSLSIDLKFQNFKEELNKIESHYSEPDGILLLLYSNINQRLLGCCGVRKFVDDICELKRMYIRHEARGFGYAKKMLEECIQFVKSKKYNKMRLDTLPHMKGAIKIYKEAGFYNIEPYRYNPIVDTKYMELLLP